MQVLSVPNESVLSFTEMEESQCRSEQAQNLPFHIEKTKPVNPEEDPLKNKESTAKASLFTKTEISRKRTAKDYEK